MLPQSARREDDGEERGHAEREECPYEEEGSAGRPAGVAVGAAAGMMGGATADLDNARIGGDFIDDVNAELLPNRVALVAEIEEDWATPVDTRMEAIGGTVFRRALS